MGSGEKTFERVVKNQLFWISDRFLSEPARHSADGGRRKDVWERYEESALLDFKSVFERSHMRLGSGEETGESGMQDRLHWSPNRFLGEPTCYIVDVE